MTRSTLLLLSLLLVSTIGTGWAAYRLGERNGYTAGRLSVYEAVMGGAVMNLAALPVREAHNVR